MLQGGKLASWLASTATMALIISAGALPAGAQSLDLRWSPGPPPGLNYQTDAYAVSGDGVVVVGSLLNIGAAFVWTPAGGFEFPLGSDSIATAVSTNGSFIAGRSGANPIRWSESGGLVTIGLPQSAASGVANAISGDGSVVAGSFYASNLPTAFRWSDGTTTMLLAGVESGSSDALGISADGKVIVGRAQVPGSGFQQEAVRWVGDATTAQPLGKLDNSDVSAAYAASSDGSVIVGVATTQSNGQRAFRWATTTEQMADLGVLAGGSRSLAYAVSSDGSIVVGESSTASGPTRAVRWVDGSIETVEDWLRGAGATIATDVTARAKGVSADGQVIVGNTADGQMFIARASGSATGGNNPSPGGGTPAPGMVTIDDLANSLGSTTTANTATTSALGTVLNGAGSRPLDRWVAAGRATAWAAGDLGRTNHQEPGSFGLGEIGFGYNFGALQINGGIGRTSLTQSTLLGGETTVDANYAKFEVLAPLYTQGDDGLWAAFAATGLQGDADFRRNYLANGGSIASSSGASDVSGYGLRGRLQWQNLVPYLSPYADLAFARSCIDGYSETGGPFPASFGRQCGASTELRIGVDATVPVTDALRLIGTLEGVREIDRSGSQTTGSVDGLGAFSLSPSLDKTGWVRAGIGLEADIASSTLSMMANATTKGSAPSAWLAASWQVRF